MWNIQKFVKKIILLTFVLLEYINTKFDKICLLKKGWKVLQWFYKVL